MFFGDPFGRKAEPGDSPTRIHARLACRLLTVAVAAGMMVARQLAGSAAVEPFWLLALVVMGVLAVLSYVL